MTNHSHEIADARFHDHMEGIERMKRDLMPPLAPPDDHMPPDEVIASMRCAAMVLAFAVPVLITLAVAIVRGMW